MKKRKQKLLYAAPLLLGLLLTSENALAIPAKSLAAKHSTVQKTNQVSGIVTDKNGEPLIGAVSYTHLTLPTKLEWCRSRWSPYH